MASYGSGGSGGGHGGNPPKVLYCTKQIMGEIKPPVNKYVYFQRVEMKQSVRGAG